MYEARIAPAGAAMFYGRRLGVAPMGLWETGCGPVRRALPGAGLFEAFGPSGSACFGTWTLWVFAGTMPGHDYQQ